MDSIDLTGLPIIVVCTLALGFGALTALISCWVSDVAATLKDEEALIPSMLKALSEDQIPQGPRWGFIVIAAIVCGLIPLVVSIPLGVLLLFVILAVPASVMDARLEIIPEELTWGLLFLGALLSPWNGGAEEAIMGACLAGAAIWTAMAIVEYTQGFNTRSGGDISAAIAGGAWSGFALTGSYLICVCAIFIAYFSIVKIRSKETTWVPMGPALFIAIPLAPIVGHISETAMFWALSIA